MKYTLFLSITLIFLMKITRPMIHFVYSVDVLGVLTCLVALHKHKIPEALHPEFTNSQKRWKDSDYVFVFALKSPEQE